MTRLPETSLGIEVESLDEGIIDRPEGSETTGGGKVIEPAKAKVKKRLFRSSSLQATVG
jgi:hypothetical protein